MTSPTASTSERSQESQDAAAILGHIDQPRNVSPARSFELPVEGWVIGHSRKALAVDLILQGRTLARVPVNQARPDVAAAFPRLPASPRSGFRHDLRLLGLPEQFELDVRVVLEGDQTALLATLPCERRMLPARPTPDGFHPLMVTSLGRSGSSWLCWLLGLHPEVFTYGPFGSEPRVASYWSQVFADLVRLESSALAIMGPAGDDDLWRRQAGVPISLRSSRLEHWLATDHVESVADFCRDRIRTTYQTMHRLEGGRPCPKLVAEKCVPNGQPELIWELFTSAREIILVRDLRDLVTSVLAYNQKHEIMDWGRHRFTSEMDFVRGFSTYADSLLAAWAQRGDRVHLVRYEDLVGAPRSTLEGIFEYLGVDSTPATTRSVIERASQPIPGSPEHRTSTTSDASIGRWRRDLSPELQEAAQEVFTDVLSAFGY